jgi:hypothetical protein
MMHEAALHTLLEGAPDAPERPAAEEHVTACQGCWQVIRLIHELVTGDVATSDLAYGCNYARDSFYVVSGLDPAEARRRYPAVVDHVAWCARCRRELAMLVRIEGDAAASGHGSPAPASWWRSAINDAKEQVHELATTIRVHVDAVATVFRDLPLGWTPEPIGETVAMRGPTGTTELGTDHVAERLNVELSDSGVVAYLTVEPVVDQAYRVRLIVGVSGAADTVAISIRRSDRGAMELVAAQNLTGARPLVMEPLDPARYTIDIYEVALGKRFRIAIDVQAANERQQ